MPASSIGASPQATRHCLMHVGRLELTCFDTNLLMQKFTKNQQYLHKSNNRSAHIDSRTNASFGIHWIQCLYTLELRELCTWSLDVFSDYITMTAQMKLNHVQTLQIADQVRWAAVQGWPAIQDPDRQKYKNPIILTQSYTTSYAITTKLESCSAK